MITTIHLRTDADIETFCEETSLPLRIKTALLRGGLRTVGQLEKKINSREYKIRQIGEKSEQEIRDALTRFYAMKEPTIERYGQRF